MAEATKEEKAWMRKLSKLLSNPPSERLGLYTTGDNNINVYDNSQEDDIDEFQRSNNADFCNAAEFVGASLGVISSKASIHSTSG